MIKLPLEHERSLRPYSEIEALTTQDGVVKRFYKTLMNASTRLSDNPSMGTAYLKADGALDYFITDYVTSGGGKRAVVFRDGSRIAHLQPIRKVAGHSSVINEWSIDCIDLDKGHHVNVNDEIGAHSTVRRVRMQQLGHAIEDDYEFTIEHTTRVDSNGDPESVYDATKVYIRHAIADNDLSLDFTVSQLHRNMNTGERTWDMDASYFVLRKASWKPIGRLMPAARVLPILNCDGGAFDMRGVGFLDPSTIALLLSEAHRS